VQLRLPWLPPDPSKSSKQIAIGDRLVPVSIARHRRARRYVIRLTDDGGLRLTVPRGATIAGGLAFAERQTDWIRREWRRQEERVRPWTHGTEIWFRGERSLIEVEGARMRLGVEMFTLTRRHADLRPIVESHLRALATPELTARCQVLAAETGHELARVSVRNQRSRWGACSSRGVITLNWRLVQMPPSVSDYVIYHELMHLRQPNHSRRFWREVDSVCAGWREAERWLRRFGKELL